MVALLFGRLSHQLLIKDTSGSQGPESGYCCVISVFIQPASQRSWPELPPGGETKKRRKEHRLSPKRQDRCQSNSATCADIKHYCILTFHMSCNSAVLWIPTKTPRKALCLYAVCGLIFYSRISSFHSVSGDMREWKHALRGKNLKFLYRICYYFPLKCLHKRLLEQIDNHLWHISSCDSENFILTKRVMYKFGKKKHDIWVFN